MDFIVIDIEQAYSPKTGENDQLKSCIYEIGIILVKDYKIDFENSISFLVKPNPFKFARWNKDNLKKSKITENEISEKPEFDVIYNSKLKEYFENYPIFYYSYSNSDIKYIQASLSFYNIELPKTSYIDVDKMYQNIYRSPGITKHSLETAHRDVFNSDFKEDEHRAYVGAKACSEILIKFLTDKSIKSLNELSDVFNVPIGDMSIRLYSNLKSTKKSGVKKTSSLKPISISDDYKSNAPKSLGGKDVLFTCLSKSDEVPFFEELVKLNGGTVCKKKKEKWTKSSPSLIVIGDISPHNAHSKKNKASDLGIEIISKEQFLNKVNYT